MKVYITQYALTKGIIEAEARICTESSINMIEIEARFPTFYHKPYWHESKEDAIEHAEELRYKKVQSLLNQIKKLNTLKFT